MGTTNTSAGIVDQYDVIYSQRSLQIEVEITTHLFTPGV